MREQRSFEHRRIVEQGYDRMAGSYLSSKDPEDEITLDALQEIASDLSPGANVLDLGCGAGIPATRWLSEQRYSVTGVDFSERQLDLARKLAPSATFIQADMTELEMPQNSFDAVVALHSIIHVPREEHPAMLAKIHSWLKPGGPLLATLTMTAFEGEDKDWENWGAPMRWSHYDRKMNEKMLAEAGFETSYAGPRTGRGTGDTEEIWLWVMVRKPA